MRALFLLLIASSVFAHEGHTPKAEPEHAHTLPPGTGAAADGMAWLVVPMTGLYYIHNAKVLGFNSNPMNMTSGRPYLVMPHKGQLIWTPPGGKQGPVPKEFLYPPVTK